MPTSGFSGSDTLSLAATDSLQSQHSATVSLLTVGPLAIAVPTTTLDVKAGGSLGVSGISLTDPSLATTADVTVTLGVNDGTLALLTAVTGGVTAAQVTGNSTGSVSITAPLAAINATLAAMGGLTYTPTSGFNGPDTLALTAADSINATATRKPRCCPSAR